MKETLRRLFLATLADLALDRVIPQRVSVCEGVMEIDGDRIELGSFKKIILVALGKAALQMARTMKELLEPRIVSGIVVSSEPVARPLPYMLHYQGGHPYPTAESVHAAEVILELLQQLKQDHLVIYLLSGGGSAIVEKPIDPAITLEDLREFYRVLVTCGANIVEMNILRKHFSAAKGGRMAVAAHPARQMTLYVSDVPLDRPSTVASGPTMPDESTIEDCWEIARRLNLLERFPASIRAMFEGGTISETPKPGNPRFDGCTWRSLLSTEQGLEKLAAAAQAQGWAVEQDLSVDDWPVEPAAEHLLRKLAGLRRQHPDRTVAVLTGGELSSPVTGNGVGGRNQAFVLACAQRIGGENIAVISAGTDGIDGNSPATGAVADGLTLGRAVQLGLEAADYFQRSDSYGFFSRLNDTLVTGPTGNNIRDLRLLVAW
jgi:hydroxypyruvate reductase